MTAMMCSFRDAIAWAHRQPDSTIKDCVINRMEYECRKAEPIKPKYHKGIYGKKFDTYSCGNCGAGIAEAHWNFCPNCGADMRERETNEQTDRH